MRVTVTLDVAEYDVTPLHNRLTDAGALAEPVEVVTGGRRFTAIVSRVESDVPTPVRPRREYRSPARHLRTV